MPVNTPGLTLAERRGFKHNVSFYNYMKFEWDDNKNLENTRKHGISFEIAQRAFLDNSRIIAVDIKHSDENEKRYFCFGQIDSEIVTVRFTVRDKNIRIIGAGKWREGRKKYEAKNKL